MFERRSIGVAGLTCLDMFPPPPPGIHAGNLATLVEPGSLHFFGPMGFATGGCVPNVGLALHKLGFPAQLVTQLGDDEIGQMTINMLQRSAGDNPELLRFVTKSQLPGVGGSYSLVGCVPGVDRWFHHYPGPNAFFDSQSVPFAELDKTRLLHFGYPPLMDRMWQDNGDELAKMFAQARKHEIITSLDMAYPHPSSAAAKADWPTIYKNTLPYVSIFLPSLEELIMTLNVALHATGLGSILSQLSTILLAYGVPIVVIKCGDKGLYLRTSNDSQTLADAGLAEIIDLEKWTAVEMFQPCFQVEVAGTTGAGDTTIAGFLASITTGQEPEKTCQMAAATGACCVEHLNATDGIKPYTEIEARVLAGWETADLLTPLGPDWETDTGSISLGPNHVAH